MDVVTQFFSLLLVKAEIKASVCLGILESSGLTPPTCTLQKLDSLQRSPPFLTIAP